MSSILHTAQVVAVGSFAVLAISIAVYALGSFVLMARHTAARTIGLSFRELMRETWTALLTQPFLPLYYVVGHRMGRAASKEGGVPVVFVHGYMQNRVGFVGLARRLTRRGLGPLFGFNYPWFASLTSNATRLDRFVARICTETGSPKVDLVCHSMGGLVAMEMMGQEALANRLKVRRCVTIATPHAGVMWRGPILGAGGSDLRRGAKILETYAARKLTVPCLSIYSTHDNIVHPKESSSLAVRGGRDVEVEGLAHLSILFSPHVAEHVATFLASPDPV